MKKLEIGGIYSAKWLEVPCRIIGMDAFEVFYDCQNLHDKTWAFSGNFKKKVYFYRTAPSLFENQETLETIQPLTEVEKAYFRPDLPMRTGRFKTLGWNTISVENDATLEKVLSTNAGSQDYNEQLMANEIIVLPYGAKGGFKKGVRLTADNGKFFTTAELIWKSNEAQQSVNKEISNGIGLYRLGFEQSLPSYYIGEYFDKAGLIKE